MTHEILSVKLCELDDKFSRMRSRIELSESASPIRLKQEISALENECAESGLILREKLRFSRAEFVSKLSEAYEKIGTIIKEANEELELFSAEQKILLAEYSLDFAMQAADKALLLSLQAIDAQMTQQEERSSS